MTAAVTGLRPSWSGAAPDGFVSAARLGSNPPPGCETTRSLNIVSKNQKNKYNS